ncbi:AsmA family protein [Desulfovibrio sp. X2]|uniref:AsmA family protein n=1 Tax=Desulfovibrio sp. X2 TaxID=941449 RepID=UPI000358AA17|nr:AsmA family protein [Desulfovibrio sp. X2]EPR43591.1 AsmA family protein [Desulfovibrio sp. X2]
MKRLTAILGLLAIAFFLVVGVLPRLLNTAAFVGRIDSALESALGANVRIEGGLRLEIFPHAGFEIRDVVVDSPEGFEGDPAARLVRAVVRVEILPLLRRELKVRVVRLEGLSVHLVRNPDGRWNLNPGFLPQQKSGTETLAPVPAGQEGRAEEQQGGSPWKVVVERVRLSGMGAEIDDRVTGHFTRLTNVELDAGEGAGRAFTLSGGADLDSGPVGLFKAVQGRLTWTGGGHGSPDGHIVIESSALDVNVDVLLPGYRRAALSLASSLGLDMATGEVDLKSLTAKGAGLEIACQAKGHDVFSAPSADGQVRVTLKDPAAFFQVLGGQPPAALEQGEASASLSFTADGEAFAVSDLDVRAGTSRIGGSLRLERYADPIVTVDLSATDLDVGTFLIHDGHDDDPPASRSAAQAGGAVKDFVAWVQGMDLEFRLHADNAEYQALKARDLNIQMAAHGGEIKASRFQASLPAGRLLGDVQAEVREDAMRASLSLDVLNPLPEGATPPPPPPAVPFPPKGSAADKGRPAPPPALVGLKLSVDGKPEAWSGSLKVPEFNPRDIYRVFSLAVPKGLDAKALTRAALTVSFSGGANSVVVDKASLSLDGASLDGKLRIDDLDAMPVRATLNADRLDLDRYMPLFAGGQGNGQAGAKSAAARKGPDLSAPLGLRRLAADDAVVQCKAGWIKAQGVTARDLAFAVEAQGGRCKLSLSGQALGGGVNALLGLGTENRTPVLMSEVKLSGVDLAQAAQLGQGGQSGSGRSLRGKLSGQISASARGANLGDILAGLSAQASLSLDQGAVLGAGTSLGPVAAKLTLKPGQGDAGKGFPYVVESSLRGSAPGEGLTLDAGLSGPVTLARSLDALQTRQAKLNLTGSWARMPERSRTITAQGLLDLDTAAGELGLGDLQVQALGTTVRAMLKGTNLNSAATWRGSVDVAPFSPRAVLEARKGGPIQTRDPAVLASASAVCDFTWGKGTLVLENIRLGLDATRISGRASIASFDPLDIAFDIEGTDLNVDSYREPRDAPDTNPGPVKLPIDFLANVKAKGSVHFDAFTIYGVPGRNVNVTVAGEKGFLQAAPCSATVCGGRLDAVVTAHIVKPNLILQVDGTAQKFQLGELLVSMAGAPYAGGVTTLKSSLTFTGATNDGLLEDMDGKGRLEVSDGWLLFSKPKSGKTETSLRDLVPTKQDLARAEGQARGTVRPEKATAFATADTDILVNNGVVGTAALNIEQPWGYKAEAKGGTDLVKEEVDYRVSVQVFKLTTIPVAIRGPWDDVKVEINTGAALVNTVKDAVTLPFRILRSLIP